MSGFYWTKDVAEAKLEQQTLVNLVETRKTTFSSKKTRVGLAIGTSHDENTKTAFATCVLFNKTGEVLGDCIVSYMEVDFPYIPGLLAFRVGPAICLAIEKVHEEFDFIIFDGQGIAHPCGFGLASHLGVLFNKPSIGVTKKSLFGKFSLPPINSYTRVRHPKDNLVIGYCVSTQHKHEPFFVSPGHGITLSESMEIIKMITRDGCLPNPIKIVHSIANRLAKGHWEKNRKV